MSAAPTYVYTSGERGAVCNREKCINHRTSDNDLFDFCKAVVHSLRLYLMQC